MLSPEHILYRYTCGQLTAYDVQAWALEAKHLMDGQADAGIDALCAMEMDRAERGAVVDAVVGCIADAAPDLSERMRVLWAAHQLVEGQAKPIDFCRVVQEVDAKLMDDGPSYPAWIEALWQGCDWCDDGWTRQTSPHLYEDARQFIAEHAALLSAS